MATSQSTIDFILDQAMFAGNMRAHKMFGEYALYCDEKVIGLVCDDLLYLKITEKGKEYLAEFYQEGFAYPGAKASMLIAGDRIEDREWLSELIRITVDNLPLSKSKKITKSLKMGESKFSVLHKDQGIMELTSKTDHKILAIWAIDCVERVLPYFEKEFPKDNRPRQAIKTLREWINTGMFKMAIIRKASLESHAAAREVGTDNAARSAARAAGQAVATAHVPTHSIIAANYALQAVYRAANYSDVDVVVAKERDWQYHRLLKYNKDNL